MGVTVHKGSGEEHQTDESASPGYPRGVWPAVISPFCADPYYDRHKGCAAALVPATTVRSESLAIPNLNAATRALTDLQNAWIGIRVASLVPEWQGSQRPTLAEQGTFANRLTLWTPAASSRLGPHATPDGARSRRGNGRRCKAFFGLRARIRTGVQLGASSGAS